MAEAHYLKALDLTSPDAPGRAELLVKCASVQWLVGKTGEAEVLLREAIEAFRTRGDRIRHGDALVVLSQALRDAGRTTEARRILQEAIDLLEPEGETPELARALVARAVDLGLLRRWPETLRGINESVRDVRAPGDAQARLRASSNGWAGPVSPSETFGGSMTCAKLSDGRSSLISTHS